MKEKDNKIDARILRRKVEELLKARPAEAHGDISEIELLQLLHEHEVHQIGLEIQNEELLAVQSAALEFAEKYQNLFENVQDVFYRINLDGVIQEISPSINYFSEIKRRDLIGTNVSDLYYIADQRQVFLDEIKKNGEVRDFEVIFKMENGATKVASVNARLIFDENGQPKHIDGALRDITERKIAEESSRESDKKFKNMFDHSPYGKSITQFSGEVYVNQSFCDMLGYTKEELPFLRWQEITHPDDIELTQREIDKLMNGEKEWTRFEKRFKHKNGLIVWAELGSSIYRSTDGNLKYLLTSISDITERKQMIEELIKAKEKAEESDKLKSVFLANMSHEIRTPMNGILGFAQLLKEPQLSLEEQQEYLGIIDKSGKRMLNIINDIVSISKIEAGQVEVVIDETDVNEQVAFIYDFFKPEVEKKGMQLLRSKVLPLNEAVINSDREKIYAILTNLVGNALKFTRSGIIEIGVAKKGSFLEFFVKDTGIGVPDNQKEIIFTRFRQGNDLIIKPYEGTGLGLSISKAYVELLGGTIWVESELGKGSAFFFTLPGTPESEEKQVRRDDDPGIEINQQGMSLKILIAEDDEPSELLLSAALKGIGREVITVRTGVEAVEAGRKNPDIDLILMDIRMPEMDGYEATRKIREFNKKVIIIAQTAFALIGDGEKAIEAGCDDYISKPVGVKKLLELIGKYFSGEMQ